MADPPGSSRPLGSLATTAAAAALMLLACSKQGDEGPVKDQGRLSPGAPDAQGPGAASREAPTTQEEPGDKVAFLGFVAGGKWAIFADATTTKVYDSAADRAITWRGRPLVDARADGFWPQFGFPPTSPPQNARTSRDGRLLLLREEGAISVVDLARQEKITTFPGQATDAQLTDGDRFLAVQTAQGAYLVPVAGKQAGATEVVRIEARGERLPSLEWNDRSLHFKADGVDHVVDRKTWGEWPAAAGARLVRSLDGGRFVLQRQGTLELWNIDEKTPRFSVKAERDVEDVHADGPWFAWRDDKEPGSGKADLHVVELATGASSHFPTASDCFSPESIVGVRGNILRTHYSCGAGCLSEAIQATYLLYDRRTGKVLGEERGPYHPPPSVEVARRQGQAERETARLGTTMEDAAQSPTSRGVYLYRSGGSLVIGDAVRKRVVVRLDGSTDAAQPVYSDDGTAVAAASTRGDDGWVWQARTGRRLFRFSG